MTPRRFMPALLLLFVGSGCAALVYEIVWFQLLQLVIGSSAVSLGVLLGTFMGGMCLGSLLLPRFVSDRQHPLRVYAWLEMGIGVIGVAVLFGMPLVVRHLHRVGRHRRGQHHPARHRRRHLPAAADDADGGDAARRLALGADDAGRRLVARLLLRRQHRWRGHRQPARRLLSPARSRHRVRDLRGCGAELRGRRDRAAGGAGRALRVARGRSRAAAPSPRRPARGRSISRSRCPASPRSRRKSSGPACCRS